jgi:hypothetical protein
MSTINHVVALILCLLPSVVGIGAIIYVIKRIVVRSVHELQNETEIQALSNRTLTTSKNHDECDVESKNNTDLIGINNKMKINQTESICCISDLDSNLIERQVDRLFSKSTTAYTSLTILTTSGSCDEEHQFHLATKETSMSMLTDGTSSKCQNQGSEQSMMWHKISIVIGLIRGSASSTHSSHDNIGSREVKTSTPCSDTPSTKTEPVVRQPYRMPSLKIMTVEPVSV